MFIRAQKTATKEVTYTAADGSTAVRRDGSKAWRCNNPGNLGKGSFSSDHGAIGAYDEEAVFPDRETGQGAMKALLQGPEYGGLGLSIRNAIAKYAPADDGNDVEAYQRDVHEWSHLDLDTRISDLSSGDLDELIKAMEREEGWTEGTTVTGAPSGDPAPSHQRLTVISDGLNVRATPSLQGTIVGALSRGVVVDWLDTSSDDYWRKIQKGPLVGWASHKYLLPTVQNLPASGRPWMEYAYAEIGVKEVSGGAANPRIVEYLHSTNLGSPDDNSDETPWCSGFVNWCVEKSGNAGTDSATALSWATWGKSTTAPVAGDLVVFNWGGGKGHVGFFVSGDGDTVKVLGGNQSDEVDIKSFARSLVYRLRAPV